MLSYVLNKGQSLETDQAVIQQKPEKPSELFLYKEKGEKLPKDSEHSAKIQVDLSRPVVTQTVSCVD
jgi:hypothetical protein